MASLIDVIFLLLLFFMLASTFSQRVEIDLSSGSEGAPPAAERDTVLRLTVDTGTLVLDGEALALAALPDAVAARAEAPDTLLAVEVGENVDVQRLTDVLLALRGSPVAVRVIEPGEAR
jgi:biopolymer transport protein ExbD